MPQDLGFSPNSCTCFTDHLKNCEIFLIPLRETKKRSMSKDAELVIKGARLGFRGLTPGPRLPLPLHLTSNNSLVKVTLG